MVIEEGAGYPIHLGSNEDEDEDKEQWARSAERLFGPDDDDEEIPAEGAAGRLMPAEVDAGRSSDEVGGGDEGLMIPEGGWRRPRRYAIQNRYRKVNFPHEQTQREIYDHISRHQPPEGWCEYCARGQVLCAPHRRIREEYRVGGLPTVSMDLGFVRRRGEDGTLPMVAASANIEGETSAHGLKSKHVDATQGSWLINAVVSDSESTGYKNITLKSDQEPVMNALQLQMKEKK